MSNAKSFEVVETLHTPLCSELDPMEFPKISVTATKVIINGSIENLEHLLREYGITCRFNMLTREDEITIPGIRFTPDNQANCAIQHVINLCINNNMPKADVVGHLKAIADRNSYNPIMEWIESKPWDGKDRLNTVIDGVNVPASYDDVKQLYLNKWFMCAVGMLNNGLNGEILDYEGILVFQGDQGLGKTMWFKQLVPKELRHLIRDGLELDLNNKDSRITFASHWLVELGELDATFKKSEISALKAFTTMSSDKIRRPYDRVDTILYRRTVMFASVNDEQFLQDTTGNRRFWCLPVTKLSMPGNFDAQQFWAQVKVELANNGGAISKPWFITGDEARKRDEANALFSVSDPIEESLMSSINLNEQNKEFRGTATAFCKLIGINNPSRPQLSNVKKILKSYDCEEVRTGNGRFIVTPYPQKVDNDLFRDLGFERLIAGNWSRI